MRQQINDITGRMDTAAYKNIKLLADSINKQMTKVEEALYQTKLKSGQDVLNYPIRLNDKISGLYDYANSGYTVPSKQAKETYADLSAQTDVQLDKLKTIMNNEVKEMNVLLHKEQVPVIGWKN